MKTTWGRLTRRLFPAVGHPSFRHLVDWDAGELDERWLVWTTKHVLACPRCRRVAEHIRQTLVRSSAELARAAAPPSVGPGVERLLSTISNEMVVRAARDRHTQEQCLWVVARLTPYFGPCPLSLLERVGSGRFLSEAHHLAEIFLGRRAAGAMIEQQAVEPQSSEGIG
jgi:hypothetical protein